MREDNIKGPKASLEDAYHDKEHSIWSRRSFLKSLGLVGGASFLAGRIPVTAFAASPLSMGLSDAGDDRILVMIRLQGGNDGLNTIIPLHDFSQYRSLRPGIHIPENAALPFAEGLGLHPSLAPLLGMWQSGAMKLLNNVGYPEQNLSHFRSSDIWASASDAQVEWNTGWLGRFFDDTYPGFLLNPPDIPPAIQIGGSGDLVFHGEENVNYAISVPSPEQLEYIATTGGLHDPGDVPDCLFGEQLSYIRTITNNTFKYAEAISGAYEGGINTVDYNGPLGRQLSIIARLIKGGLGTRMYVVTLNGFDTHAGQLNQHANLLQMLAHNVKSFYDDLQVGDWDDRVLSFTFSEFGRRPAQNASQGTDHGAAAPMFLWGKALDGQKVLGGLPNLHQLDTNGNLRYELDFRRVYASVMEKWLCVDSGLVDIVMGQSHDRIDLGIDCRPTSFHDWHSNTSFWHEARYGTGGVIHIHLQSSITDRIRIELINAMGQSHGVLFDGYPTQKEWFVEVPAHKIRIPGYYFYRIHVKHQVHSGKLLVR